MRLQSHAIQGVHTCHSTIWEETNSTPLLTDGQGKCTCLRLHSNSLHNNTYLVSDRVYSHSTALHGDIPSRNVTDRDEYIAHGLPPSSPRRLPPFVLTMRTRLSAGSRGMFVQCSTILAPIFDIGYFRFLIVWRGSRIRHRGWHSTLTSLGFVEGGAHTSSNEHTRTKVITLSVPFDRGNIAVSA